MDEAGAKPVRHKQKGGEETNNANHNRFLCYSLSAPPNPLAAVKNKKSNPRHAPVWPAFLNLVRPGGRRPPASGFPATIRHDKEAKDRSSNSSGWPPGLHTTGSDIGSHIFECWLKKAETTSNAAGVFPKIKGQSPRSCLLLIYHERPIGSRRLS